MTKYDRNLLKMQADKNVIVIDERDMQKLHRARDSDSALDEKGDSSGFESDKHVKFMRQIEEDIKNGYVELTDRTRRLLHGVHSQKVSPMGFLNLISKGI